MQSDMTMIAIDLEAVLAWFTEERQRVRAQLRALAPEAPIFHDLGVLQEYTDLSDYRENLSDGIAALEHVMGIRRKRAVRERH